MIDGKVESTFGKLKGKVTSLNVPPIDATLTKEGQCADAKAAGDAIAYLKENGVGIDVTQAEYDALSYEEKMKGTYYITDGDSGGVLNCADVVDNLLSTATDLPLSANQGRVLNEKFTNAESVTVTSAYTTLWPRRLGNIGFITKYGKFDSQLSSGTEYCLGTLPETYRPARDYRVIIDMGKSDSYLGHARVIVYANGEIWMMPYVNIPSGVDILWGFIYPIFTEFIEI